MQIAGIEYHERTDELEAELTAFPKADCPLEHTFTPGLYSRSIFMPQGIVVVSRIHKTEHQFIISKGSVLVRVNTNEWQRLKAPFLGITKAGTRRILVIEEDCVWTTLHPTSVQPDNENEEAILEAVNKIEEQIIEPHVNRFLGGQLKNNILIKELENA